ncbi:Hydrolase, alpha/beta fold protein family [Rubellimicrobium mesophilum DSM 19309]|uniref:Hydrolase, alpha/beta fold protein family n=1 Tax=Rubellimicrobium mesophilum DSM 19309 TaxID=442562 RepID=A0A017HCS9_9RHOB|nr:alpha/beta hydrolase [Rubellimicrobium mesophilum]EYD71569.1 Hydrolase, alpha/beta fold protein family [Rubellimicrobium mesophilum DSM 19309]
MPHFTTGDGAQLHFTDEGEGLPVLALAGLTRNGGDFDHVAPLLPGVRLIRLDARGRGRSDFTGPETYNVWQEAKDATALLDHLGIGRAALLGTSRGGLVGMVLAATAKDRLLGVALNDVGPVIEARGLVVIAGYLGRRPAQRTWDEAARARAALWSHFRDVPHERWLHEVRNHYEETPEGLQLRYDPRLREAFLPPEGGEFPALWPFFEALDRLPVAVIRGETSDILSPETLAEMRRRRPDMIVAEVPGRGHVPFLDEPQSLAALHAWLDLCREARGASPAPVD